MKGEYWNKIPTVWKQILYKEWLLFISLKYSLKSYLWDDSYGLDFLLIHELGIESNNPQKDLQELQSFVEERLNSISDDIIDEIFSMEFISLDTEITYLSPLAYFKDVKVIDFHCSNVSYITDFSVLNKFKQIYIFNYADYQIIDFETKSNIEQQENIVHIKQYGFPREVEDIIKQLTKYNIN